MYVRKGYRYRRLGARNMVTSSTTEVNDTNVQLEMFINWLHFLYHIPKLYFYLLICVNFQIIGITRGTAERRKR